MFVRGPLERLDCVPHAEGEYNDFHLPDGKMTQITINITPVALTVEHGTSSLNVMGLIPRECMT